MNNTQSFTQSPPQITVHGGCQKDDGVSLLYSLSFLHRECHATIESRIRSSIYSYHLAMKRQPLLTVIENVRRDLALARTHAVKLAWSESGER